MSERMSNETKRRYYHTIALALALAVAITLCFRGFSLGWWEKLAAGGQANRNRRRPRSPDGRCALLPREVAPYRQLILHDLPALATTARGCP